MKISIILAHPAKGSFNHAIARTSEAVLMRASHEVRFHDLYGESFDPLIPSDEIRRDARLPELVAIHCHEIAEADGIVIVHPNWWGQPPSIMKGWIDRVMRPGVAYEFVDGDSGEGVPHGLLKAKTAIVFNTSNTPMERERNVFGDPLDAIWRNCVFGLCGVSDVRRRMFNVMVASSKEQRKAWLEEVGGMLMDAFPTC